MKITEDLSFRCCRVPSDAMSVKEEEFSPDNPRLKWDNQEHGLYGRDREAKLLTEAYRRCVSSSSTTEGRGGELVLVTGTSGTGKTALVNCRLRPFVLSRSPGERVCAEGPPPGYFVMGKFDQLDRPEQYYPMIQAMTELVDQFWTQI